MNAPPAANPDRSLLPASLVKLVGQRYRGVLRRLVTGGPKRRTFTALGGLLIVLWLVPVMASSRRGPMTDPESVLLWGPLILAGMTLLPILFQSRQSPIAFTPAEVDFVLPGPFSRRQLVLYRLLYLTGPLVLMAVWFGVLFRMPSGPVLSFFSFLLLGQFTQLVAMNLNALRDWLGDRWLAVNAGISALILGIVGWAVMGAMSSLGKAGTWSFQSATDIFSFLQALRHQPILELSLGVFDPFVRGLAAQSIGEASPWLGTAALMNLALITVLLRLDRGQIEQLVIASQRQAQAIERMRRGSVLRAKPSSASRRVPMPPFARGAGPLFWRQATTAYRAVGPRLLTLIVVGIVGIAYFIGTKGAFAKAIYPMLIAMTPVISGFMRGDFRGDLDHLPMLKALPIPPMAMVAGQIALPVCILCGAQWLVVGSLWAAMPTGDLLTMLLLLALALPMNVVMTCIDNAIFLYAPIRSGAGHQAPGFDPARMGRQALVGIIKLLALASAGVLAAGPAYLVFRTTDSLNAAIATAGLVFAGLIWPSMQLVAVAFAKFDPAIDQPA